MVHSIYDNILV